MNGGMIMDLPDPISTDGPPIDVPLLRKAVEWAEAEAAKPERESEWFQGAWVMDGADVGRACGTTYCVAGYVCFLTGALDSDGCLRKGLSYQATAAAILGMTRAESFDLFLMAETLTDVRHVAERIAARAGERL